MISIVTTFSTGHNGIIRRNALRSWRKFIPDLEIIIAGECVDEIAKEVDASVVEVKCSEYGTPFLSSLLEILENANGDIRVFISGDIILLPDLYSAIIKCSKFEQFLAIGRRLDINIDEEIDITEGILRSYKGVLHGEFGLDYMVSKPGLWRIEIPTLVRGRGWDDGWMLDNVGSRNIPTIDLTLAVTALHQNHGHNYDGDIINNPEWKKNHDIQSMACGTNSTSHYMLENGEIIKR